MSIYVKCACGEDLHILDTGLSAQDDIEIEVDICDSCAEEHKQEGYKQCEEENEL